MDAGEEKKQGSSFLNNCTVNRCYLSTGLVNAVSVQNVLIIQCKLNHSDGHNELHLPSDNMAVKKENKTFRPSSR